MRNWKKKLGLWLALLATVLFIGCGGQGGYEYGLPAETGHSIETAIDAQSLGESDGSSGVETAEMTVASEPNGDIQSTETPGLSVSEQSEPSQSVVEDGSYTSKEDVALYLETYGKLPGNFITKKEAQALGWTGGSLEDYAPGKCIGGDKFGNYEGILPEQSGRIYRECDIDTLGKKSRGAKRLVYSNDGLIYYTEDHYESFAPVFEYD